MTLWIGTAVGPQGEPWGTVAIVADDRDSAIALGLRRLQELGASHDADAEEYRQNLMANLALTIQPALLGGDFFFDADPYVVKRFKPGG